MMENRILRQEEFELFEQILKSTQEGVKKSMSDFLKTIYIDRVVETDDYVMAIGDIPVGIVAHMDTVHKTQINELFYDEVHNVMWSPEGLGADDRAGVYAIVEIIRRGLRPTIILTTDEECGGVGATMLARDMEKAPCELNYLIELDRRGYDDCVFYDCCNDDFEKYIEAFGFKTDWGSYSDIATICPIWEIAGVNLSIGYMDEHTKQERLYINAMFSTIDKVCEILKSVTSEDKFIFVEGYKYGYYNGYDWNRYDSKAYGYGGYTSKSLEEDDHHDLCWHCLNVFDEAVLIKDGENGGLYCGDCYSKIFSTCIECGESFKDKGKTHLMCKKCRVEME